MAVFVAEWNQCIKDQVGLSLHHFEIENMQSEVFELMNFHEHILPSVGIKGFFGHITPKIFNIWIFSTLIFVFEYYPPILSSRNTQ